MSTPTPTRITHTLPSHYQSRSSAFRSIYANGTIILDLTTVDRLLQQNDHELIVEVVCLMLDYINTPNDEKTTYPLGVTASYTAIINRLGINKGPIEINCEYLVPLYALLPDGGMGAAGFPCRKELADLVRILRLRTDYTSDTFQDAIQTSQWQGVYTDLSELYAVTVSSDIRVENLHYAKLFELLFYKHKKDDGSNGSNTVVQDNDENDEKNDKAMKLKGEKVVEDGDNDEDDELHHDNDEDDENNDEDDEKIDEIEIHDPISEDITTFDLESSLNEFYLWIGFKTHENTKELMVTPLSGQISQFLGMSYYHAVSSILGVLFSLLQKQRHYNFRVIYMLHEWFFAQNKHITQNSLQSSKVITNFIVPQIIIDYETPMLIDIDTHRAEQVYFLSYEKKLKEMGQFSPDQPEHDIGITKRVTNLPFITETRLMFISSMMEASIYHGGTHINATYQQNQYLEEKQSQLSQLREEYDKMEEEGEDCEEIIGQIDELNSVVEITERFTALNERFHEAMYTAFNTKFASYKCIIVAWIISVVDKDDASQQIIEKFFGINITNWKEYDAELYYESLQKTCHSSIDDCSIDFTWATETYCLELEQARTMLYNLTKPCSDYDDLFYSLFGQLIMIGHVDGIDWLLEQEKSNSIQDLAPQIYSRVPLLSFASQLDEATIDLTKQLVKRKAKVVVNGMYGETSNIFVVLFSMPHLSDDQVLELYEYWYGFCMRNAKTNKLHINLFEMLAILNRAWAFRYTRTTRTQSLLFFATKILPAETSQQFVMMDKPTNYLRLFFATLLSQSTYSDINPNGNTSCRFGDYACVAYEQELLGLIYQTLFPTIQHIAKACEIVTSPTILFSPMFVFQSKKAFDYVFFQLKFPVRLEIIAVMINCMLPSVDWASTVDVQSILLQYKQFAFNEQNKPKKKKGKKGTKKGTKGKGKAITIDPQGDEEDGHKDNEDVVVEGKKAPATTYSIDGTSLRPLDTQFFSYANTTMLTSLRTLEINTTIQYQTLINDELNSVKKQQEYIENVNKDIKTVYGEDVIQPGKLYNDDDGCNDVIKVNAGNKHTVQFFNSTDINKEQLNTDSFSNFKTQILSLYQRELLFAHPIDLHDPNNKDEIKQLSNEYTELIHTLMNPDKHFETENKYQLLSIDTTVLDALIWFVDKEEKKLSEEYGGFELSYGYILYTLAALITLFIQLESTTQGLHDENNEIGNLDAPQQLTRLYLALVSSLSTPQGSPIYQTFQLLFNIQHPFPVAYQHCLLRVGEESLRHFYSPWVQNLYANYANVRILGELALDLEYLVENSPQGRKLFTQPSQKLQTQINWDLDSIHVEYNNTPLFQIITTAIVTECISQSYMWSFQQHYPQRSQYMQQLMRLQHELQQQPSPYITHTYKFTGLAQISHIVALIRQLDHIPAQLLYTLFTLFPSMDIITAIVAAPELDNVHHKWKFYAKNQLIDNTSEKPSQISFLAPGTHQSWIIDVLDVILSKDNNDIKLLLTQLMSKQTTNQQDESIQLITSTYNLLLGPYISFAQFMTPITGVNEVLSMDFWSQLVHTFNSLVTRSEQFFLLSGNKDTPHDVKEDSFMKDFNMDENFTFIRPDPIYINGMVQLYNKYCIENDRPTITIDEFKQQLNMKLVQATKIIALQEIQNDEIDAKYDDKALASWDIDNVINGIEPKVEEKPEKPKKSISFSTTSMLPAITTPITLPSKSTKTTTTTTTDVDETTPKSTTKSSSKSTTSTSTSTTPPEQQTNDTTTEVQDMKYVQQQEPEQLLLKQEEMNTTTTTSSSNGGLTTVLTIGAVAGLVGAAIYAGLTYFNTTQRQNDDNDNQDQ